MVLPKKVKKAFEESMKENDEVLKALANPDQANLQFKMVVKTGDLKNGTIASDPVLSKVLKDGLNVVGLSDTSALAKLKEEPRQITATFSIL